MDSNGLVSQEKCFDHILTIIFVGHVYEMDSLKDSDGVGIIG